MSTPQTPARPDAIRAHNLSVVLGCIHRAGALTRAELTQQLGLSRSTVGALVADLSGLGLVDEVVPSGGAGVGRPSHVVGPHAGGPVVVAVDIDIAQVTVAAVGLGCRVLGRETVPYGAEQVAPQDVVDLAGDAWLRVRKTLAADTPVAGLGVSVPGTVRRGTGYVGLAPNLGWRDVPLDLQLAELLPPGRTLAVGNDADLAVLAEHHRGAARAMDDVVFLLGRIGVGAGIIANGRPLRGRDGHAGEIGHNIADENGPSCHCGKRGCVETYIGEPALLRLFGRQPGTPTHEATAAVFAAARADRPDALRTVRQVAAALGRAIASLVNTLNPECVILGGYLSELLNLGRPEVERALREHMLEEPPVQVVQPALGADAPLIGAAELAFADLLADPLAVASRLSAGERQADAHAPG